MVLMGFGGTSQLIRYCTRFTDEIFNGLLSFNFIYEAISSLRRNFQNADPMNLTMPFVSLGLAFTTYYSTLTVTAFENSKFLTQRIRSTAKDFGPVIIFVGMTLLNTLRGIKKFGVPTLNVPATFQLAGGRDFLIPINSISLTAKLLCSLPAVLLTALFFMDQNISVRVVNNPDNKLKKGTAYNLDMLALGLITGGKIPRSKWLFPCSDTLLIWFSSCVFSPFCCRLAVDVWSDSSIYESCAGIDRIKV